MKTNKNKLPVKASLFLQLHFADGFVETVDPLTENDKIIGYKVVVTHDDVESKLTFDLEGNNVSNSVDPLFSEDYYEGDFYGREE